MLTAMADADKLLLGGCVVLLAGVVDCASTVTAAIKNVKITILFDSKLFNFIYRLSRPKPTAQQWSSSSLQILLIRYNVTG